MYLFDSQQVETSSILYCPPEEQVLEVGYRLWRSLWRIWRLIRNEMCLLRRLSDWVSWIDLRTWPTYCTCKRRFRTNLLWIRAKYCLFWRNSIMQHSSWSSTFCASSFLQQSAAQLSAQQSNLFPHIPIPFQKIRPKIWNSWLICWDPCILAAIGPTIIWNTKYYRKQHISNQQTKTKQ